MKSKGGGVNHERRFSIRFGGVLVGRFLRRSVSILPPDGTVCFVDDGDETGWQRGQSVGMFKNGAWTNGRGKPLKIEPTFWTVPDEEKSSG
jgi:hypothetical protein